MTWRPGKSWASPRKVAASAKKKRVVRQKVAVPTPTVADMAPVLAEIGAPDGVRLVLPWPPRELNPNARPHHMRKHSVGKAYKHDCWVLALERTMGLRLPAGPLPVRLDFFPPNNKARDDDNAESAFKAGRDGVALALGVDDSRFRIEKHLHLDPLACVVLTLVGVAA